MAKAGFHTGNFLSKFARRRNTVLQSFFGTNHHIPGVDLAQSALEAAEKASAPDDLGQLATNFAQHQVQGWKEYAAGYPRRRRGGGRLGI